MEEQREVSESASDCRVPMEETGEALASKSETLDGEVHVPQKEFCIEDANTVEVSDSGVGEGSATDENPNVNYDDVGCVKDTVGSATKDNVEKTVISEDVEKTNAFAEPETERIQMECDGDAGTVEVKPVNGGSHETAGEEDTVISAGNEVTDEKANCEVEGNIQTEKSEQCSVEGETLSVAQGKDEQEKESANKSGEDNSKIDVDINLANEENVGLHEQRNPGFETKDDKSTCIHQVMFI